ncbi:hypothetical protein CERSUDRAFT_143926 [Gelatoporia subvermispora B]|uniref:CUE domain-containing protein n=1 Tax=Ceriporiopsis subvermispora (strain B) TaxID=914234 RepID=M2Q6M8_CERS8|nr:hypothetical protein CERSUDRAFT_143926 [Gelatoporia subvermispora B]
MGEVVNVLVAVAVIVFIFRWATSNKESSESGRPSPAAVLGFRPKNVTVEEVETVHSMFPDIPVDNIRYDLLRTGSVQTTTNKILERGFIPPPPPAYYTVYPRAVDSAPQAPAPGTARAATPATPAQDKGKGRARADNLITRYRLEDRLESASSSAVPRPEDAAGKAAWEDSPEKREASLRERKAQMILAARQRLLAQQQAGSSS